MPTQTIPMTRPTLGYQKTVFAQPGSYAAHPAFAASRSFTPIDSMIGGAGNRQVVTNASLSAQPQKSWTQTTTQKPAETKRPTRTRRHSRTISDESDEDDELEEQTRLVNLRNKKKKRGRTFKNRNSRKRLFRCSYFGGKLGRRKAGEDDEDEDDDFLVADPEAIQRESTMYGVRRSSRQRKITNFQNLHDGGDLDDFETQLQQKEQQKNESSNSNETSGGTKTGTFRTVQFPLTSNN